MKKYKSHFTEGQNANTFESIQSAMHVSSTLAMGRDVLPVILWEDSETMRYEGMPFTIGDLKNMMEKELAEAERILHEDVMKGLPADVLLPDYSRIVDQLRNRNEEYNFLLDPENPFVEARHNFAKAFLEHPEHGPAFADLDEDGDIVYNHKVARDWFGKVNEFLEKLFVILHVGCGLPARGTESAETLICNLEDAERNLYAILDHICIVGRYNKTSVNRGLDKLIPRALHPRLAQLLLEYLALIRPLERSIAVQVVEKEHRGVFDTHLWAGVKGKWTSRQMSDILKDACYQYTHVPMGLAAWRHVSTAIMRRKLTGQLSLQKEIRDWIVESMAHEQAGHGVDVANRFYGGEVQGLSGELSEGECKRYILVSTRES